MSKLVDPCEACKGGTCEVKGTLTDYVTGREFPDTDVERVRQRMEHFLVEEKGYSKEDLEVAVGFEVEVAGDTLKPRADLVVRVDEKRIMVIKCVFGAMEAGMRLVVSYGRLLDSYQIPYSVITNGEKTHVMDTVTGIEIGGVERVPVKGDIKIEEMEFPQYPEDRVEKEKRIFSAYEDINQDLCSAF